MLFLWIEGTSIFNLANWQDHTKTTGWSVINLNGMMGIVPRKNPFNFGSDMDKWSVPGLLILLKLSDLGVGIMPH